MDVKKHSAFRITQVASMAREGRKSWKAQEMRLQRQAGWVHKGCLHFILWMGQTNEKSPTGKRTWLDCVSEWPFHHRIEKGGLGGEGTGGRWLSHETTVTLPARGGKSLNKDQNEVNGGEERELTRLNDPLEVKDDPQISDLKWTFWSRVLWSRLK